MLVYIAMVNKARLKLGGRCISEVTRTKGSAEMVPIRKDGTQELNVGFSPLAWALMALPEAVDGRFLKLQHVGVYRHGE